MQLRMVARRSISGSMTVVGDMGQSTAPGGRGLVGQRRHAPRAAQAAVHASS